VSCPREARRVELRARAWQVPSREWEWVEAGSQYGVHTREGKLVWWTQPLGPNGRFCEVAGEQAFADFAVDGHLGPPPPPHVLRELNALLGLA
jgi:hypothetical protein